MDMTCEKSLTPLLRTTHVVVGVARTECLEVNNGLVIAPPQHPLLDYLIHRLALSYQN